MCVVQIQVLIAANLVKLVVRGIVALLVSVVMMARAWDVPSVAIVSPATLQIASANVLRNVVQIRIVATPIAGIVSAAVANVTSR